ncbi:putative RNA-directed DNA polymerase from transposon BS [Trichonephila inaurata madagascariensis]|uniref:Putative RNA-directed DNA polymerase from transposon BS n=1 Tax=Trichonephila inaurata madagascariensis TaxID=2747483 RepID=A0A8X6XJY1_9ARAC|nr:putative RNA-directed DNA polymerase from transposon BS [Trichonephila inaurata madagascariensis]
MRYIGQGLSSLETFCSLMCLQNPVCQKAYDKINAKIADNDNAPQIGLFAEDVVLWCSDANISKMESQLNRSLVNIQEFARNHKITFNVSKHTVSLFTTNTHLYNYSPELFLTSERLDYSKYLTYLGFTLDSKVNCGKHIEKIADKARKRLKILKYLSGRDWGSDASTLRITYTTLVRPVLEYGCQIFQVASPTNLKKTGKSATQSCEDYHRP